MILFTGSDPVAAGFSKSESSAGDGGSSSSDIIITHTVSPQACLSVYFANSCSSSHPNRRQVKAADDAAPVGLHQGDEREHDPVWDEFINRCDESLLPLNTSKTEGTSIDFRRETTSRRTGIRGRPI